MSSSDNAIRRHITPAIMATEIRLLRETFSGPFLLVEGDRDVRLFKALLTPDRAIIRSCNGRLNVIQTVRSLDPDFAGHLGVIDKDYGDIFGENLASQNLIWTAYNDIEMDIFFSKAFDRLIAEYANEEKIIAVGANSTDELRTLLLRAAAPLGALRFLSRDRGWNLKFEHINFKFVEAKRFELDIDRQIAHFRGKHDGKIPGVSDIKKGIDASLQKHGYGHALICGHDLCAIISRGLHEVFGRARIGLDGHGFEIEEVLRTAYSEQCFALSAIRDEILRWQQRNPSFQFLGEADTAVVEA